MQLRTLIFICLAPLASFGGEPVGGSEIKGEAREMVLTTAELRSMVSSNAMAILDNKQKITMGDRVVFQILEDRETPITLTVVDPGEVDVPYIGRWAVHGKTCKEAAFDIKAQLEKTDYYRATVLLRLEASNRSRGKIQIIGHIRTPGTLDLPPDEVITVSKAILRAGGFAEFAKKTHVKLTRKTGPGENDKEEHTINVDEIWTKQKTDTDMVLQPDDVIFVPQRLFNY